MRTILVHILWHGLPTVPPPRPNVSNKRLKLQLEQAEVQWKDITSAPMQASIS